MRHCRQGQLFRLQSGAYRTPARSPGPTRLEGTKLRTDKESALVVEHWVAGEIGGGHIPSAYLELQFAHFPD
jgi:hypothetical protein